MGVVVKEAVSVTASSLNREELVNNRIALADWHKA
jgi:hypothetical protein